MSGKHRFIVTILVLTSVLFAGLYLDTSADLQFQIAECKEHKETIETLRELNSERYNDGYKSGYESGYYDGSGGYNNLYESFSYSSNDSYYEDDSSSYTTVYITRTGSKYHQSWCSYLSESKIAISLSDALDRGYDDCSRCW